jgi:Tfp pilus assembly protein PilE
MKNLNRFSRMNTKLQKGMTLIELAIVGLFLGLLALFGISQFSGSATDTTKAAGLYEASGKIADSFTLASQTCGTTTDVASSPLAATAGAANTLSVLLGTASPATSYVSCFNQSGVRPLAGLTTGAAGSEKVYGYGVTIANPGSDVKKVGVSYSEVPEALVLALYNKYSSATGAKEASTLPATADTSDAQIRFSTATNGTRTLTIVRAL